MARTATSGRGGLAGAAIIMMTTFALSRATGLVRDVAVSALFGTGREMDAYLAAIRIPDFIFQVTAGGAVASAFIPVFAAYLARDETESGWRMVSTLFNLAVVVLSPLVILLIAFAPQVMQLIAAGLEPEYQELAGRLARILLIMPLFFTLGCFTTSVLNTHQRFLLAALAPTAYNLGIIFGALALAPRFGIRGLAAGTALGSLLFLLVQVPGLVQVGMRYLPVLDVGHQGVRDIGRLMVPRALGLAVVQVNFVVTLYLASWIPGGPAALNWAWLLTMLPLGVFGMAISSAVFPALATQTARAQVVEMRRTAATALRFILYLTIPATIGLAVLGESIIQVLFQRGAFTTASTAMTVYALRFYAPGLIAMAAVEIVTRTFYAFQDTRTPVAVATVAMVVNVVLAVALVRPLSHGGLALATSLASTVEAAILLSLAQRRLPGLLDRDLLASLARSGISALLMAAAVIEFARVLVAPLGSPDFLARATLLAGAISLGVATYLVVSLAVRSEEARRLLRMVTRR